MAEPMAEPPEMEGTDPPAMDPPDWGQSDGDQPDGDHASLEDASAVQTSPPPAVSAPALGQHESPGELEGILARLVAADITQPAVLAQLLGVDEPFIGRPQRGLLRGGIVAADATGALHLTPRGEA